MKLRFYKCEICGKIITILSDTGIETVCCGQEMQELVPNTTDGSAEKHVPAWTAEGNVVKVQIGSDPHPMTENHLISWIGLQTDRGFHFKELKPGDEPCTCFLLCEGEHAETVYAYCSLHGLWCA